MGHVYGRLIIGVPVTRDDFFVKIGKEWRCARNGHIRPEGSTAKFCEHDGSQFHERSVEEPTVAFKSYADENSSSSDPDEFWDILNDTYGDGGGIHCVDTISSCESSESLAFGFRIAKTGSACDSTDTGTLGFSLEFIAKKMAEAEALARRLGIDRKARLFLNLYASY